MCFFALGFIRTVTSREIPDGESGEVIFSPLHGYQWLDFTVLEPECHHHSKQNQKYTRPYCECVFCFLTCIYVTCHIICICEITVCLSLRVSRMSFILVIRVDESQVKTQSPTVAPVTSEGPGCGILNQDIGEFLKTSCGFCPLSVYEKHVSLPLPDTSLKLDSHGRTRTKLLLV